LHRPSYFPNDVGLRPCPTVSALPTLPPSDSGGDTISRLTNGLLSLRPVDLLAPLVGADQAFTQPTGTFTSGLSTAWSPAPPPDITTGETGQAPLAGLSPARTPTSIAAMDIVCRGLSLGYVSFRQIRAPVSPFPPVGPVAAPSGSPAVPHLRWYYGVVRLLSHPCAVASGFPWRSRFRSRERRW